MQPELLTLDAIPTPIGMLHIITNDEEQLCALGWYQEPRARRGIEVQRGSAPPSIRQRLEAYFHGELEALRAIAVHMDGTPFMCEVWQALRDIPAGTTLSYGALAAAIGRPKATRAVGLANNRNPIGIVVPCHRVIGANGSLTGYAGGLDRKRWLLQHEGALLA